MLTHPLTLFRTGYGGGGQKAPLPLQVVPLQLLQT